MYSSWSIKIIKKISFLWHKKKVSLKVSWQSFSSVFFKSSNKILHVFFSLLHVHTTAEMNYFKNGLWYYMYKYMQYYTNIWVKFIYLSFQYAFIYFFTSLTYLKWQILMEWKPNHGKKKIKDATLTKSRRTSITRQQTFPSPIYTYTI